MPGIVGQVVLLLPRHWRARLRALGGDHKQIARGMVVVALFVLFAKLIAMFKEMAVAWHYGISETVDAYLFVFNIVQWPLGIVGNVIGAVLVPFAARLSYQAPQDLSRFRSELFGATSLLALGLGVSASLVLPWLVQQPWIGLEPAQVTPAREMAVALAWVLPLGVMVQLWAGWTMAGNRQLNTLLEGMPALAILIAVLVASGVGPLIWGTIIGFALQASLLYLSLAYRGEGERPHFLFVSAHWPAFMSGIGVMFVGLALMSVVNLADQFFAAHLGVGALSTLGYANRILALVLGLGATAIARASLPVLSRAHAEGRQHMSRIAFQWSALLFSAGLLVTLVGLWLAPSVVELLFQRGQFTARDASQVAEVLRYALIQVPFYFSSMILVYGLLSQGRHKMMLVIGGASLVTKLLLALALVPTLGLNGLVLATAGVYLVSGALAFRALRTKKALLGT